MTNLTIDPRHPTHVRVSLDLAGAELARLEHFADAHPSARHEQRMRVLVHELRSLISECEERGLAVSVLIETRCRQLSSLADHRGGEGDHAGFAACLDAAAMLRALQSAIIQHPDVAALRGVR